MSSQSALPAPSASRADIPRLALQGTPSVPPPPLAFPRNGPPPLHRASSMGTISIIKKRPSGSLIPSPLNPTLSPLPSPMPHPGQIPQVKSTAPDTPPPFPEKVSRQQPSKASPEEVTPWDFQTVEPPSLASPTKDNFEATLTPTFPSKSPSIKSRPLSLKSAHQPSLRSRASSTVTGLVEEVTPWELYPPIPEKNTKYHIPDQPLPEQTSSTSQTTSTGSVEEVTPWELVSPPETLKLPASHTASYLQSVDEVSVAQLFDSEGRDYIPSSPRSAAVQLSHTSTTSSQEKVQKTGPAEDVTPWELEPGPGAYPTSENNADIGRFATRRLRSSLTLAQVEDITPWELHPASSFRPPADNLGNETDGSMIREGAVIKKKSSRSGNPFTANNKTLSDLAFVRGRKHGSLHSKSRLMGGSMQSAKHRTSPVEFLPTSRAYDDGGEGALEVSTTHHQNNSSTPSVGAPPGPPSPVTSTLARYADADGATKSQYNPSTADRKILSQLEFVKDAHDKEFVLKGQGYQQQNGGVSPGKLHHVYSEIDAPYPRCYDFKAQDLDIWELLMFRQICDSWTWHVFETPPRAVLDIGCGTGSWVIHAAGEWKDCHFWGVDLVPIQPDFNILGDRDLKERVHWVHHNFLKGLPFEDEQFDYIHIKRIGLGVPENKWDALFEECSRVLKPGGAFEMIEEDLIFPGKPNDNSVLPNSAPMELERDRRSDLDSQSSKIRGQPQSQPISSAGATDTPVSASSTTTLGTPLTPMTNLSLMSPSTPAAPPDFAKTLQSPILTNEASNNSTPAVPPLHVPPQSRLAAKPALHVKMPSPQGSSRFSNSAVSLLNSLSPHPSASGGELAAVIHKRRLSGLTAPSHDDRPHGIRNQADPSPMGQPEFFGRNGNHPTNSESYLLNQDMAPVNPRDHAILETIYMEMLSSRFINPAPLSLLPNYIEYHFTDIRTHPPLQCSFPSTALLHSESRYVTDSEGESESSDENSSDDDEARDAIRPKPLKHKSQLGATKTHRSRYRSTLGRPADRSLTDTRLLSRRDLMQRHSPYVSFDESRAYALSPSTAGKNAGPVRVSRIPNSTLRIDLKTLNMHLHLKSVDILGCSEPMWEWVTQHQAEHQADLAKKTLHGQPIRPMQREASPESTASMVPLDPIMSGIAELTREDYDILLSNFEMDMQDQAAIDFTLQEQVNWRVPSTPRDLRQKAFDEACKKWDRWVAGQEKMARRLANHRRHAKNGETRDDKPTVSQQHRYSSGGLLTPSVSKDGLVNNQGSGEARNDKGFSVKQDLSPPSHIPFSPSKLLPHQRLSRSFRVFIAWKARDPSSLNQAVATMTDLPSTPT